MTHSGGTAPRSRERSKEQQLPSRVAALSRHEAEARYISFLTNGQRAVLAVGDPGRPVKGCKGPVLRSAPQEVRPGLPRCRQCQGVQIFFLPNRTCSAPGRKLELQRTLRKRQRCALRWK